MSTQTKSAAELRVEVANAQRSLDQKTGMMLALLKSTQTPDGPRQVLPHQADQLRSLKGDCERLDGEVKALILDHMQAEAEEGLNKSKDSPYNGIPIHSAKGGQDGHLGDPVTATKGLQMIPDLGEGFTESPSYKGWIPGGMNQSASYEAPTRRGAQPYAVKTTLSTSGLTGFDRPPGVVLVGQQQLTIADLFAQGTTTQPTIRFLAETSFTNAADATSEGVEKNEAAWALDERDSTVRKIAVVTKVTDELFADFAQVRSYINERMPFMVRQREEFQLLNGPAATAPNIVGVLNTPSIQTQPRSTDTNVDAIYKAITKVRFVGFFEPDAIVIDPTNWTPIRLLKTTTGEYVWGPPSAVGPETLFGKTVVVTANMVDNTALVGAFKIGGMVFYREGLRIEATNSNEDDFNLNLISMRAEQREALVIWRPPAFCTVTGLST